MVVGGLVAGRFNELRQFRTCCSIRHKAQQEFAGIHRSDGPTVVNRPFAVVLPLVEHLVLALVLLDQGDDALGIPGSAKAEPADAVATFAGNLSLVELKHDFVHRLPAPTSLLPVPAPSARARHVVPPDERCSP